MNTLSQEVEEIYHSLVCCDVDIRGDIEIWNF